MTIDSTDPVSRLRDEGADHKADDSVLKLGGLGTDSGDLTEGVQKVEDISRLWSTTGLVIAWTGMMLIAIAVSLDGQTVSAYQPYALSEFGAHAMIAAISTLQNIL